MNEAQKLEAIGLLESGWNKQAISDHLGIPRKTVSDFLNKKSHRDWWVQHEGTAEGPRILMLDIETAPTLGYVWGRFKQYLSQDQIVEEGYVLCWAAKWLDEDQIFFNRISDPRTEDDKMIILDVWKLLDACDIIVCHNAAGFDIPTLNARFVYHGLPEPSPYKVVDTLQIAKKRFRFPSNKLESLAVHLGLQEKMSHSGFDLWRRVMRNESKAWVEMEDYNRQDVVVLEEIYKVLRPWDRRHPNVGLYYQDQEFRCTVCGEQSLSPVGKTLTSLSVFQAYQCDACGHIMRDRVRQNSLKGVLVNAN